MANNAGRRAVVQDPLAPNARENRPDRSLQLGGVRAPQIPSDASLSQTSGLTQALQGVEGLLQQEFEKKKDEWITEGKVAYQSGVAEHEMLATGNAFTERGYRTMQARDQVNNWFTNQTIAMDETGKQMDPAQYATQLKEQRASILSGINDPHAKKVASAAFEDMSPRLAAKQAIQHNEYNRIEGTKSFSSLLSSTGSTSATASVRETGSPIAISPVPVGPVMSPSAKDRDVGIRTMLGEAGNQGAEGLAAVAHVMRNRTTDSRWPGTIEGVALQPKQFSTWNAGPGGNNIPYNAKPGSPAYERAGQIFDAVMAGKHVDPTGGATHYYSPAGMQKLVDDGDQANSIPGWLDAETAKSGGRIKIGGHIFVGKATGADNAPQPQNEVQQLIYGANLKPEDKAAAVADAMRRTLDAGDEKLFNDAGGIAVLHNLRAKPSDIDEVIKAKKRYDDKKQTEFNVENVKFEDSIKARAEKGEALDTILTDIDARHKSGLMNDANARALATSAADTIRRTNAETSSALTNPDFLNEVGALYQAVATGSIEQKHAIEQAKATAASYGASEKDVQKLVTKIFELDQGRQNSLRAKAEELSKQQAAQAAVTGAAARAISNGYGLSNVTGSVKVANSVSGQPGETITAQEYGVRTIKDRWSKEVVDAVNSGKLEPGKAKGELERKVAIELQNHGIVDKETVGQIDGALKGNFITKDNKVSDEAKKAYDTWLNLKRTPELSPAYLAKVVPDPNTRNLLEHAFLYDSGSLSPEQSLMKAHEILNDPNRDPNNKINKDVVWKQKLDVDLTKALLERTHPGFLNSLFATKDPSERERILRNNKTAENWVVNRAEMYHSMNQNEDGAVSLEKSIQDLQANSTPVMGNLIITKPGQELDKVMGVSGFGPNAAEEAISNYIRANGEKLWGKSYTDQYSSMVGGKPMFSGKDGYDRQSKVAGALSTLGTIDRQFSPQGIARAISPSFENADDLKGSRRDAPPVSITYDHANGIITVDLYKDAEMKSTLGSPKYFKVAAIGAAYAKEQTAPGTWAKTWNSMFKGTANAIRNLPTDKTIEGLKADYNNTVDEALK